ncbi:MAG: hypothetical protein DRO15_00655 [Thermoprotei archaeon]|nr:MAG: hypothetical protein DRO15_00655 [Thermoprotei archaeon]
MNGIELVMILGILILLLLVLGRIIRTKPRKFHNYLANIQIVDKGEVKSLAELVISESIKCLEKLGIEKLGESRYIYLSILKHISNPKVIKAIYHYKKLMSFYKGSIDIEEAAKHFKKLTRLCGSE